MIIEQAAAEDMPEGMPIAETIDEIPVYDDQQQDEEGRVYAEVPLDDGSTQVIDLLGEISSKLDSLERTEDETEKRGGSDGEILVEETSKPVASPTDIEYTDKEILLQINDNIYAQNSVTVGMISLVVGLIMGVEVLKIWLR